MPRDNDKNNDSRGRRDRPVGGKGRSGRGRGGPEKKFAKRGFAGKDFAGKRERRAASLCRQVRRPSPMATSPMAKSPIRVRANPTPASAREAAPRALQRGTMRPARAIKRALHPARRSRRCAPGRAIFRPEIWRQEALRIARRRWRETALYPARRRLPQGRSATARPPRDDRPRGDRPDRKFGGDKKFSRGAPDRVPRKDFGSRDQVRARISATGDRGDSKPWQKRDASAPDHVGRNSRPPRDGARNFDKPRFDKPRYDKPREARGFAPREIVPRFSAALAEDRRR